MAQKPRNLANETRKAQFLNPERIRSLGKGKKIAEEEKIKGETEMPA